MGLMSDNYIERATEAEAEAMIGRTWIETVDYFDIENGRTISGKPRTWTVVEAKPCDDLYYWTCPDTERRVDVKLERTERTVNGRRTRTTTRALQPEDVEP